MNYPEGDEVGHESEKWSNDYKFRVKKAISYLANDSSLKPLNTVAKLFQVSPPTLKRYIYGMTENLPLETSIHERTKLITDEDIESHGKLWRSSISNLNPSENPSQSQKFSSSRSSLKRTSIPMPKGPLATKRPSLVAKFDEETDKRMKFVRKVLNDLADSKILTVTAQNLLGVSKTTIYSYLRKLMKEIEAPDGVKSNQRLKFATDEQIREICCQGKLRPNGKIRMEIKPKQTRTASKKVKINLCRLCMKSLNVVSRIEISSELKNQIENLMNVDLPSENFPNFICDECHLMVDQVQNFKSKILNTQTELEKLISDGESLKVDVTKLKVEDGDEIAYFEDIDWNIDVTTGTVKIQSRSNKKVPSTAHPNLSSKSTKARKSTKVTNNNQEKLTKYSLNVLEAIQETIKCGNMSSASKMFNLKHSTFRRYVKVLTRRLPRNLKVQEKLKLVKPTEINEFLKKLPVTRIQSLKENAKESETTKNIQNSNENSEVDSCISESNFEDEFGDEIPKNQELNFEESFNVVENVEEPLFPYFVDELKDGPIQISGAPQGVVWCLDDFEKICVGQMIDEKLTIFSKTKFSHMDMIEVWECSHWSADSKCSAQVQLQHTSIGLSYFDGPFGHHSCQQ